MKHIIIDPGHGGTLGKDSFRQGPSGEREEWINLSVAKELQQLLIAGGFIVTLTRRKDVDVSHQARVDLAIQSKADLFVSIHHASCDPVISSMNFPFFYIHGSFDSSVKSKLINSFKREFSKAGRGEALAFSDLWVFDHGLFVLRECEKNNIPAILTEFSFFSNPEEELKLKTKSYCEYEAQVLFRSINNYFSDEESIELKQMSFPFEYKTQLKDLYVSLVQDDLRQWREYIVEAEKKLIESNYVEAVNLYEKALALNPYHPNIKRQLEKMIACTEQISAIEYKQNLEALSDFIL